MQQSDYSVHVHLQMFRNSLQLSTHLATVQAICNCNGTGRRSKRHYTTIQDTTKGKLDNNIYRFATI
jgi:hypothetical protein